jgi:hypothetical protein
MNVFLIPASTQNFNVSIRSSVRLDVFERHLDAGVMARLIDHAGNVNRVHCWAFRRGPRVSSLYRMMEPGDVVLFRETGSPLLEYMGEVAFKVKSESLGNAIWPLQVSEPWENIYLLKNLVKVDIGFDKFKHVLGYDKDYIPEGAITVTPERYKRILKEYGTFAEFINAIRSGSISSRPKVIRRRRDDKVQQTPST